MIKDAWDYIYGGKSHMNLAGKLLVGVPMAPFVLVFVITLAVLENFFSKKKGMK